MLLAQNLKLQNTNVAIVTLLSVCGAHTRGGLQHQEQGAQQIFLDIYFSLGMRLHRVAYYFNRVGLP